MADYKAGHVLYKTALNSHVWPLLSLYHTHTHTHAHTNLTLTQRPDPHLSDGPERTTQNPYIQITDC
jgi:hypothetical protein